MKNCNRVTYTAILRPPAIRHIHRTTSKRTSRIVSLLKQLPDTTRRNYPRIESFHTRTAGVHTRRFVVPNDLSVTRAIFTVALRLPIQSVPASLRGEPEASEAGDQGRGVGGRRVRVAVRLPLQRVAQLLHLDHVHTSMFRRPRG